MTDTRMTMLRTILVANDADALKRHLNLCPSFMQSDIICEIAAAQSDSLWAAMESVGWSAGGTPMTGTPLISAALQGNAAAVQWLIAKGADVDEANSSNLRALDYAATQGHQHVADLLLEHTARLPLLDFYKKRRLLSATEHAVSNGQVGLVERWIQEGRIDPKEADSVGETLLMKAIRAQHEAMVARLLPLSDLNAQSNGGYTALMMAAKGGHVGLVQTLLHAGASTDAFALPFNAAGKSVFALECAVYEKRWACADLLALCTPQVLVDACVQPSMPLPMYHAKLEGDLLRATVEQGTKFSTAHRQRTRM